VRVLTLNTWQERGPWRERWEVIFGGLHALQPGLVFFQEVFNTDWIQTVTDRTLWPSAVHVEPASGLALFSQYPLLDSGSFVLKGQSDLEDYRRYLLFGKFKTEAGIFFAFNTHLSWRLEDSEVRAAQTKEIAGLVRDIAGTDECLIAGDFNAVAWSPEIKLLTREKGFLDVYQTLNAEAAGLTWTHDNFYTREGRHPLPDRRIDYIFSYQAGQLFAEPKTARVVLELPDSRGILASDHYGVFAEFNAQ